MVVRIYVCNAKYSKRITLKHKYIIICGYIIPLYSIKIHFFLTLHFQSIRMLHLVPYFKISPSLKIRPQLVIQKRKTTLTFNKCFIVWTKFLMYEFFRFKDAHLQFRASIAFKYFPWYIMYYVSLCLISININCKK